MTFNRAKFKELVLHMAQRSVDDHAFGRTKLNKLLYFADFHHYRDHGTPITGADYQKLDHGPAPRAQLPIVKELIADGDADEVLSGGGGYEQVRLVALRDPDLSLFTGSELAVAEAVIDMLAGLTAKGVSDLSHASVGWRVADIGDTIPYASAFWTIPSDLPTTEEAGIAFAKELGLPV